MQSSSVAPLDVKDPLSIAASLAYWQKRMRLQEWDVKVQIRRYFDMGPDRKGEVNFSADTLQATVNLLDPADYDPGFMWPYDPEKTLIHELAHLYFAGSAINDNSRLETGILERAVVRITDALWSQEQQLRELMTAQ